MRRFLFFFLIILFNFNKVYSENIGKAYFAGGCFWCMEESFEKVNGVLEVISGYSGGRTTNPTYKEVIYGDTGHFETIEVRYNKDQIKFNDLLEVFWKNIDPFDSTGQFCDKGFSYRSVAFYNSNFEKNLIDTSISKIEKKFKKKVVTFVKRFDKFYEAENYHQDYYKEKFLNYLIYKKNCKREEILNSIWN